MERPGWLKLRRKFLDWEWYSDKNVSRLFIHLLLNANYEPSKYRGVVMAPGSVLTGRILLSEQTGLSQQQVRTALNKLKSTNEITIKTSNKSSIIRIVSWKEYQDDNQQPNKRITNEQPTDNQQVTTSKEGKEGKKGKKGKKGFKKDLEAAKAPPKNKRGTRISQDWVLPDEWKDWAITQGANATLEGEKFYDYWIAKPGQGGVKLDWAATWRNWIRNSTGRAPPKSGNGFASLLDKEIRNG